MATETVRYCSEFNGWNDRSNAQRAADFGKALPMFVEACDREVTGGNPLVALWAHIECLKATGWVETFTGEPWTHCTSGDNQEMLDILLRLHDDLTGAMMAATGQVPSEEREAA